ncbi:EAL domain-containing protein [Escherichia coli]|uniref:EAL domain-containing protein n=1 Tax=Escherichia coli TaxID=562 RepID=UPI00210804A0|nr:EAL domain-containing protein [Escherichia coli]MCQ1962699.1 EAL domain-containing protein [Escherichia coli]MCQ1971760.1 EAL domain-containing protein [Escherichia coli]
MNSYHIDKNLVITPEQISRAIENQEFTPYFQPIFCSISGDLTGCEVLLRWEHPEMRMIFPEQFIPVAESSNLIVPLTSLLMKKTESILKYATHLMPDNFYIGINVNSDNILAPEFEQQCIRMLEQLGKKKIKLVLELSERIKFQDTSKIHAAIETLQNNNILFALDDFGMEYSTFHCLQSIPVDFIKLDKIFIQRCGTNNVSDAIVDSVTMLARRLRINIVAEGIETIEQAISIKNKGIEYLQGYLFSPPVSGEVFIRKCLLSTESGINLD